MGRPPPLHPDTFTAMNTVALHILLECDLCPQRCASSVGEPSRPSPAASPPAGPGLESRPRPRAQARSPLQPSSLSSQPSSSARGLCSAPWPTAGTGCPRTQCCRAADRSPSPTSSSPSSLLRASRFPAAPEASCSLHPAFKAPRTRADATSCPSASVLPSSCDDGPPPTRFARDADTWTHECVSQGPVATRRSPASGMSPALRNAVYDLLSETTHLRSGA